MTASRKKLLDQVRTILRRKHYNYRTEQRYLYLPEMHGSSSLKSVLPALVSEMSYDDLAISDGIHAMEAFLGLVEMADSKEIERVREALWMYCEFDTLAMVGILEELWKVCGR
jgi:hypothetical protein